VKITNKSKIPSYFAKWLKEEDYDFEENTLSATTLLKPTKQYILEQRHSNELEEDVMDRLASKIGSAVHNSLEQVEIKGALREQRLRHKFAGVEITGKFDLMLPTSNNTYKLVDFKTTKTYKWVMKSYDDYITQLSIYRWLADKNGINVDEIAEIGFWFKDWEKRKTNWKGYPSLPLKKKKLKLWSLNKTEEFIKGRLQLIFDNQDRADDLLLDCKEKELWITKKGIPRRCDYCSVRKWCKQYAKLKNE